MPCDGTNSSGFGGSFGCFNGRAAVWHCLCVNFPPSLELQQHHVLEAFCQGSGCSFPRAKSPLSWPSLPRCSHLLHDHGWTTESQVRRDPQKSSYPTSPPTAISRDSSNWIRLLRVPPSSNLSPGVGTPPHLWTTWFRIAVSRTLCHSLEHAASGDGAVRYHSTA